MQKFITKNIFCISKHYYFLALFCFLSQSILAQNEIKGTVTDSNNMPLAGVNIIQKGTSNGVVSDFDGLYSLTVTGKATLVYSFIGFVTKEIVVSSSGVQNVQLEDDLESLDEVVIIGYGSQLKEQLSGSVATVDIEELSQIPQVSVDQLIQGRAAGVTVTQNTGQPGGAVSVKIRGVGSLNGSTEPLYIIDGIPVSADTRNIGGSGQNNSGASSPLSSLNPNDIESLSVLKDASATAIYGSRASNGVVIITTKKGKTGKSKINFNTYTGVQKPYNLLPTLNLKEYAVYQNNMREVFGLLPLQELSEPGLLGEGVNWQKVIFDDAILNNHQLSFSGGNEDIRYYTSAGITDQDGTLKGTTFDRYSIRLNLDAKLNEALKVGISVTANRTKQNLVFNGDAENGVISRALLTPPNVAAFNPDGSFAGPNQQEATNNINNPIAEILTRKNQLIRDQILGNIYADLKLFKGLSYRVEFGGNFGNNRTFVQQDAFTAGVLGSDIITVNKLTENTDFWIVKNLLNYNNTFGDNHSVTLLAGHESQENSWNGVTASGSGFLDNSITTLNNADASTIGVDEYKNSSSLESFFGRAIYTFDRKYTATAAIRADGSSKFSEGNKWGYFPSLSLAWNVSNEPFMENLESISNIKIYGGYGETGNQDIPVGLYSSNLSPINTQLGTGFNISNIANPDLTWETRKEYNLGLDFTTFGGKLNTTIEVYSKTNSDFLFQTILPASVTGGGSIQAAFTNEGEMVNKGIDLALNYAVSSPGNFNWNSTLTLQHYTNEVTALLNDAPINSGFNTISGGNEFFTQTKIGDPIGLFVGYQVEGLFRTLDDLNGAPQQFGNSFGASEGQTWLGDIKFKDVSGPNGVPDGVIDDNDKTEIGNPHPDFTFGWQNSFSYKGFELSCFLQGSYGNDVLNVVSKTLTETRLTYRNQFSQVLDYWTPQNPQASRPRYTTNKSNNLVVSDRYIEDGSYLRIQNIKLGYSLPSSIFEKTGLSKVNLYGSIQNLYTFTNYSGYDPELGALGQNPLLMGLDNGRYPTPRTFTIGLDIEF